MIHYLQFQIYWPSTPVKVEECIMKGKDAVSTVHCTLNKSILGCLERTESLKFCFLFKDICTILSIKGHYIVMYNKYIIL